MINKLQSPQSLTAIFERKYVLILKHEIFYRNRKRPHY